MPPTILITRPEPAGSAFARAVRARIGRAAAVERSPLMRILFEEAAPDLAGIAALIFTSRNGVAAFARLGPRRDIPCFAVGEATARAAREAGFDTVSAGGDARALVDLVRARAEPGRYLHIRGQHAAGDVAQTLTAAGIDTREAVLYRQEALPLSPRAQDLLSGAAPVIVPLFSPRTARLFFQQAGAGAPLLVAAISRNVAAEVPAGKAVKLLVASQPDAAGMMALIGPLLAEAKRLEGANRAQ